MAGKGGKTVGAGRPKGSKNKKSLEIQEKLQELNCDPIEGLVRIAMLSEEDAQNSDAPKDRVPHMNIAKDCYKELAGYVAYKLKSVEHSGEINHIHDEDQATITGRLADLIKSSARAAEGSDSTH